MALINLNIDDPNTRESIRSFVSGFLANRLGVLRTDDEIILKVNRKSDHIAVDWDGKVEASMPGIDPDLIRAKLYETHAEVDLRISGIRIDYS